MYCELCGAKIPDDMVFCPECGGRVNTNASPEIPKSEPQRGPINGFMNGNDYGYGRSGQGTDYRRVDSNPGYQSNQGNYGAANQPYEPDIHRWDGIKLTEGEQVIRTYKCCDLLLPNITGKLSVTNKRILFTGAGSSSRVSKELKIDSVSGIDCHYGTNIRILRLIVAIILAVVGFIVLGQAANYYYAGDGLKTIGIFLVIIGGVLGFLSVRPTFNFVVYAKDTHVSPISLGEGASSLVGNTAIMSVVGRPGADTDRMLREIGALIMDLQMRGDLAIDSWKETTRDSIPVF